MKKLRLLYISVFVALFDIVAAYAVTLPSQSYVADPLDYMVLSMDNTGAVKVVGTTYANLGSSAGSIETYCTYTYSDVSQKAQCSTCCSSQLDALCEADPDNCSTYTVDADSCAASCQAYSLPIDGGLYLLLTLAVAFGAAKVFKFHKKGGVEHTLQCCHA